MVYFLQLSLGNSSEPMLGAYRPHCDQDGLFTEIQCHEHYCWCVETDTGRPTSDMVPFENSDDLPCTGTCTFSYCKATFLCEFVKTCLLINLYYFYSCMLVFYALQCMAPLSNFLQSVYTMDESTAFMRVFHPLMVATNGEQTLCITLL